MTALKTLGLCVAAWIAPVVVSFVALVIAGVTTERWGASRLGPVIGGLLIVELLVFGAASILLWWGLKRLLSTTRTRILVFALHALLQLANWATMSFSTLVAFNR
jgi:hypothetical protein